jgi:acyl-[acyl-carrier-protein]-phospholipid O-acyltransferase/long-chain-fatty-acid--[acyl-carrier-protein] ligase
VITSRRFIEVAKLEALAEQLASAVEIVWLEDLRARLGLYDKLYGLLAPRFAAWRHCRLGINAGDPAAILFTSGSEGAPKGVVLSHANLLANGRQLAARVDFSPADQVLNALPMFHSFGLTAGFLLPLLSGVRVFLYPSPLHYRIVPELAYGIGATLLFGPTPFSRAMRVPPAPTISTRCAMCSPAPRRCATRPAASGPSGSGSASLKAMA